MSRDTALVSADWAEKNLDAPGIVFVEVDEDTTAYDGGHIPGAVKLDWKKDLQDPVRRDFVNQEQFDALLSERGIGNDDTVVLYGGNNNWFAAYAYWYFKLYGHGDVKLLDGGRKKWELDARPYSKDVPNRAATSTTPPAPDLSIRAFRDEVVQAIGAKNLVDVRSPDEFAGRLLAPAHLPQEQSQRGRAHPDRDQRAVEQGGQRGRHLQVRRRAAPRSTARPAWTTARTPSRTAGSASAPRTPGSCSRSCSASRTSRTTTVPGPSTARSSACRSRSATSPERRDHDGSQQHGGRLRRTRPVGARSRPASTWRRRR